MWSTIPVDCRRHHSYRCDIPRGQGKVWRLGRPVRLFWSVGEHGVRVGVLLGIKCDAFEVVQWWVFGVQITALVDVFPLHAQCVSLRCDHFADGRSTSIVAAPMLVECKPMPQPPPNLSSPLRTFPF